MTPEHAPTPPSTPLEHDLVYPEMTLDQVREAYQSGDQEAVQRWYKQRQEQADRDPSSLGRFQLSVDLARIYRATGETDVALEYISGVNEAIQQELIEYDRHDSPYANLPDREERMAKMREMLQLVTMLRAEFKS